MLPLGLSAPPLHRRPYATAVLVLAMLAVFVYVLQLREAAPALFCSDLTESVRARAASSDTVQGFVCRWGAIPDELQHGRRLVTLLSSVVVHAGWLHLLANLAFLAAFAPRVEEDLGPTGLVALFFGSAVLAAGAPVLLVPRPHRSGRRGQRRRGGRPGRAPAGCATRSPAVVTGGRVALVSPAGAGPAAPSDAPVAVPRARRWSGWTGCRRGTGSHR